MKYIELFAGIGGIGKGIEQAHENLNRHQLSKPGTGLHGHRANSPQLRKRRQQNAVCVGYSEVDEYATKIYEKHFPKAKPLGDITKIKTSELPEFDFIVGGFPCQSFSIAGKRGGFDDTRGTLFFEIARILRDKKPRGFLLENVKGLLSHDRGRTFKVIITTLAELGYDLEWQVLNSKHFGVPQNRDRIFIVGYLRGGRRPQVFPFGQGGEADIVLPTLTARYYGAQANGGYIGAEPKKDGASREAHAGRVPSSKARRKAV